MISVSKKSTDCFIILFVLILTLAGCKSTPEPIVPERVIPPALLHFPQDVKVDWADILDMKQALDDRNLYFHHNGNIKMLSTAQCKLDISAHRGDFRFPESSSSAIASALNDNFNSVEIDVMLLKDGTWVNHHDSQTGRATVHYTGKRFKLERMKLNEFAQLKLRDKNNNDLLDQRPITAYEAFSTFAAFRHANQKLNVEIKSDTYGGKLLELDNMLRQTIGLEGYYYSSGNLETLYKLRGINPLVYLGFIQGGHPSSIEILKKNLRNGVKNDAYYLDNQHKLELAGGYGTRRYRSKYKDYTSSKAIGTLVRKLGSNSGLHLDIRSYTQNLRVKSRAKTFGMKLYTYSLNGADYHQSQLRKLNRAQLPDGVIVDATPYKVCQQLFTASLPKQRYQATSTIGRYITSLPVDADFDQFEQMLGYRHEGYYISLASGLRSIKRATPKAAAVIKTSSNIDEYGFPIIIDERVDTGTGKTIILTLPSSQHDR